MNGSVEQIKDLVQHNRWITVTDIGNKLDFSCGSAYSTIHEDLRYHKICAVWPKQLTDEPKWAYAEM
jgi:hypothetical protein